MNNKKAFILPLTLLMIATSASILTYIMTRSSIYLPYVNTAIEREKAKSLALGGVQIAIAQLSQPYVQQPPDQPGQPQKPVTPDQQKAWTQFLARVLPMLNSVQQFILEDQAGELGTIALCLTSQDGKIDINHIYDFHRHKFKGEGQLVGDYKKIMQELFKSIQDQAGGKNLFAAFEKFLKERQYKINDVTELLTIKEFVIFKHAIFDDIEVQLDKQGAKKPLYLTDIFTVDGSNATIDPWLLSESTVNILNLKHAEPNDLQGREKTMKQLIQSFSIQTNWAQAWDKKLAPIYEKQLQSLPKGIESMLNTQFMPKHFSIISYGKSGSTTQRVLAVIELKTRTQKNKVLYNATVKKIMWL